MLWLPAWRHAMSKALLVGGFTLSVAALLLASSLERSGPGPEQLEAMLTALYGPPGGGLSWAQLAWVPEAQRLDLDNLPGPQAARNLQQLVGQVLEPTGNLFGATWHVPVGGGFRTSTVTAQIVHPCRLHGHEDGSGLDVRVEGWTTAQVLAAIQAAHVPFHRAVVCDGFLHVEREDVRPPRQQVLVQTRHRLLMRAS